jgi:quinol-cytochrome oxidoreductase complex cytochrome b subunit
MDTLFYGLIDRIVLLLQGLRRSRLWTSIFRREHLPQTETDYLAMNRRNFFVHVLPATIDKRSMRITYSWFWMGVVSFWLFVILILSGIYLMFYYVPSVERAFDSIRYIINEASLGRFLRNLHKWAGELMVLAVFLHMLRVFYTGSYQRPREFNWVIGIFLFLITVMFAFSGYILPWDQLGYYAAKFACNIAQNVPFAGDQARQALLGVSDCNNLNQFSLLRWYVIHVFLLPVFMVLLIAIHFWRIRKDEYTVPPDEES